MSAASRSCSRRRAGGRRSTRRTCASSAPASQSAEVNRAAADAGITLRALQPREASLEEVFLRMTGEGSGEDGSAATARTDGQAEARS